jgi:hypothetical protein
MTIKFVNSTIVINSAVASTLVIQIEKVGTQTTPASANILLSGADILFPAAQQYNGLKFPISWAAGTSGIQSIIVPLESSGNEQEYILATLDDLLNESAENRAYILVSKVPVTNAADKFTPSVPGNYFNTLVVNANGNKSFGYKKPTDVIGIFTANTTTQPGTSGLVPAPPASNDPLVLTNQGWTSSPKGKTPDINSNDTTLATTAFVQLLFKNYDQTIKSYISSALTTLQNTFNSTINNLDQKLTQLFQTAINNLDQKFQTSLNSLEQKLTKLFQDAINALQEFLVKPGTVVLWAGANLPAGYLWCRGQMEEIP